MNDFIKGIGGDVKVKRTYTVLGKPSTDRPAVPGAECGMPVESGVRVDVEITANKAVEFVMVDDLKPAGFEAVQLQSGPAVCNYACAHAELRTDRVAMFLTQIPVGVTKRSYDLRAEVPGRFAALPGRVEAMYAPGITATADEMRFEVRDARRCACGGAEAFPLGAARLVDVHVRVHHAWHQHGLAHVDALVARGHGVVVGDGLDDFAANVHGGGPNALCRNHPAAAKDLHVFCLVVPEDATPRADSPALVDAARGAAPNKRVEPLFFLSVSVLAKAKPKGEAPGCRRVCAVLSSSSSLHSGPVNGRTLGATPQAGAGAVDAQAGTSGRSRSAFAAPS